MHNIGFTNGCFDLLHPGHRYFLQECQKRCKTLIVAINSDASIRALKGPKRPKEGLQVRITKVWTLMRKQDAVIPFNTEAELLHQIAIRHPAVIFKGNDYDNKYVVGSELATVVLIPRLPGYSTTSEIEKIFA